MLDADTKRRIDTARDILVGKVPDPKSQVEQITIALIYKFMDDMDAEAEELGGSRKFFAGEFARYGWAKLMRSGLGGHEALNLYAEAIAKMPENPGIPPLFRDIFKNAFLPYRDPETLRAFLKVIDEFTYDHSERLGDAFEYLLSVLGSQGDAGQFRTPRHIIDFIVSIVDPKKDETLLDPACGTAANVKGYDISPDMVRLSLVNLYLHGFADPHIVEYDTLTSQDRWNEYADVILANPPFMSPKGGIKPHNRFSVQSKRSEVLFVDYIAEHLTPHGRAGIIVPEGVIFQSQTAYTQLRKLLVEQYLVAVVSLPAGVFNPYSGVKTSILILDKALAKQSAHVAFFKIEHDGFGLGAQRRPIDKDDLPQARAEIAEYLRRLRAREPVDDFQPTLGRVVAKEKIAANGDYNLSGERYQENGQRPSMYPHVQLGEVVEILDSLRRPITKHDRKTGPYPYYGATGVLDYVEGFLFDEPLVLVGEDGAKWGAGEESAFAVEGKIWVNNHAHVLRPKRDILLDRYLIEILNEANLMSYITGVTVPKLNQEKLRSIEIPLPPLEVQREIVAEIEGYQKVIDGARAVVDNYRPHIPIDPAWPVVGLGEIMERYNEIIHPGDCKSGELTFVGMEHIEEGTGQRIGSTSVDLGRMTGRKPMFKKGQIVYGYLRPYLNKVWIAEFDGCSSVDQFAFEVNKEHAEPKFVATFLRSDSFLSQSGRSTTRAQLPRISIGEVLAAKIPLPPLDTQRAIVAELEAEQALINANRELIARMEKKIQATLARVWGEV